MQFSFIFRTFSFLGSGGLEILDLVIPDEILKFINLSLFITYLFAPSDHSQYFNRDRENATYSSERNAPNTNKTITTATNKYFLI